MIDARGVHIGQSLGPQILQAAYDRHRALAGAVQVKAPQAVETRVIQLELAIEVQHGGRGKSLFGGNAPVTACRDACRGVIVYHVKLHQSLLQGAVFHTP